MADSPNNLALDRRNYNALTDVVNRGVVAGTLGAPVDAVAALLRPFNYSVEKPVGGSEWIGQKMQDYGMVSSERRPLAELAASAALPALTLAKTVVTAQKAAQAAKKAAQNLEGVRQAQKNNTFVYSENDLTQGYGSRQGYPQPAGTPSAELFSNFAYGTKSQDELTDFRNKMFDRALQSPAKFKNDAVSTSVMPFRDGMEVVVEAAQKGNTRIQVLKDGVPVAAAGLRNGMLDSIGVHGSVKGQKIGQDLLTFIHENKLGNVLEVPDRSPGFVNIQRNLVQSLEAPK